MSKRPFDTLQNKMTRNDRFAQMSHQEKLIEQKKREIQAKLDAKRRQNSQESKEKDSGNQPKATVGKVPSPKSHDAEKSGVNTFSNDGSFLNQFKQLKDKKNESKFKSFNKYKDREKDRDREREKDREKDQEKDRDRSSQDLNCTNDNYCKKPRVRSPSPLERQKRASRFSADRSLNFEPQKITINTSFSQTSAFSLNQVNSSPVSMDNSTVGPVQNTLATPPATSTFVAPVTAIFTPPTKSFDAPSTRFDPPASTNFNPPPITTLASPTNVDLTTPTLGLHLVTTSVTTQIPPPNIIPPLMQQSIEIITPASQQLDMPTEQIGGALADLPIFSSSATSLLQQQQPIVTQALDPSNHMFGGLDQIVQAPPQVLMNVPPPQIVQQTQLLLTPQSQNVLVSAPTSILTTVTLAPPIINPQNVNVTAQNALSTGLPTVELTSIPPPNPIQLQNIPQPEPLNTLNIPPPAPLQVQNIPTPSSLQLNEIPNPKPLDLQAIPTPNEKNNGGIFSDPDFIKNVPPPNKSVPPPNISDVTAGPPPNTFMQSNFIAQQQGLFIHNIASAGQIQGPVSLPPSGPSQVSGTSQLQNSTPSSTSRIPSLMSQPVLPPPGMGVNVNCPPPMLQLPPTRDVSQPPPSFVSQAPPSFVTQAPPMTNQMPPMNVPPPLINPPGSFKEQVAGGGAEFEAMAALARMVADCGPSVEDVVRQKKNRDPSLWFLFHKDSPAYRRYANLVERYKREKDDRRAKEEERKPDPGDIYEPEMALEDDDEPEQRVADEVKDETKEEVESDGGKRKRRSRWGEKDPNVEPPGVIPVVIPTVTHIPAPVQGASPMLSKVTRSDPRLLQYALQTYGTTNLDEEDWKKAEDNYKIHLLYQDMVKKREELERLQMQGKNKYEYDSDEETEGGTWEHKLREKEMQATERWAVELNRQAEGKHHIGDFLPPEELKRFMEKSSAVKEGRQPNFSDYKEFKIKEDNIGFKMLQKLGWTEGQGLGQANSGIVEPVNKGAPREHTQGLGLNFGEATEDEDEYESYRKRMMLAYRFRPNPLNNPRRPYY